MTFKGTNWTRGELGNVPDENPRLDCQGCGESFWWRSYWKQRVKTPDDEFLCDSCAGDERRIEQRRESNHEITAYL